jgi:hypothetical protein
VTLSLRIFTLLWLLLVTSCNRSYDALLVAGKKSLGVPLQFEELYGRQAVKSGIGGASYTSQGDVSLWSQSYFYSRYSITFEADMTVSGARVLSTKPGHVLLNEITEIVDHGRERIETSFGKQWEISPAQWAAVYQAHGDFSAIGIDLKKDQPLPNFGLYISSNSFGR